MADEAGPDIPPVSVLWLDGWSDETPFVGACCGSIQTIVEKSGAKHIFDDQGIEGLKTWDSVSWDEIEQRDPDVIVLVDASWDLAGKRCSDFASDYLFTNCCISSSSHDISAMVHLYRRKDLQLVLQ